MSNVRTLTIKQLRQMIREEADLLQGKDDPADVKPSEMPWEEAEDCGKQDFVASMDKPSPAVKAEARLRALKSHQQRLERRLSETKRRIAAYVKYVNESRKRAAR